MTASPLQVGIVGGTGYTGVELLRMLVRHPQVDLRCITSRGSEGMRVTDLFPSLRGALDLAFQTPDPQLLAACDVVFFATPHGVAMEMAPLLLAHGVRVIDLSADFRLRDPQEWARWYGMTHGCPELLREAVYGLPEMRRHEIEAARLVAAPGCYPTAVQLGLLPLLKSRCITTANVIADCKSGVSGAGRGAKVEMLLAEAADSFKAYAAGGHRHLPEIRQGLSDMAGGPVDVVFVPHLLPMIRGIHATLYATLKEDCLQDLQWLYESYYADEPFVDVMPQGSHPETRSVRGANLCRIAVHRLPDSDKVVVLAIIDNLVKGAAGQAIQCMNIMFGIPEQTGLDKVGLVP